jgi:arsenite methyltransferase
MGDGITYDEAWTQRIETIYSTPDVIKQRKAVLKSLNPVAGEGIVDIGSGPGMLAYSLGQSVGLNGCVAGVDISENMNRMAAERCVDLPWVSFHQNDAVHLPFDDAIFDAGVSTQVYEYVGEVDLALAELFRVIKPGGRAVILDTDWDSIVWNTDHRARMNQVLEAFEAHCAHPLLARQMISRLESAGFEILDCAAHTILNRHFDPDTYSYGMLEFIEAYVRGAGNLDEKEINDWVSELHTLGRNGAYFFSLNRYIFVVTKPGVPKN